MLIISVQNACRGFVVILVLLWSTQSHAVTRDLEIVGWIENVVLPGPGIILKAKLDTGAETSSLSAAIIKKFRQGGKRWIRFRITDRQSGKEYIVVRQRVRTIGVIQHDGSTQTRPVVLMKVCIASRLLETEVSLIDRSEFNYPLLLGRNTLKSFALVDPGNTFLSRPQCRPVKTGKGF